MNNLVKDRKILIMDDEQMILDILSEMLNECSIETDIALDKKNAVDIFESALNDNQPHDLIILDLFINGKPAGLDTIKRLKEMKKDCRVILMSGSNNHPALQNYMEYGFVNCITKPFNFDDIKETVYSSLKDQ